MSAFNRAEHCRAIAAHGGQKTYTLYGPKHMSAIGTIGYQATVQSQGAHNARAILYGKGWRGPRRHNLAADLALGKQLAHDAR